MDVRPVPRIAGALLFIPAPHVDERGFFCRTFDADVLREAGIDDAAFVQHSLSRSALGVVRGLHVRRGDGEAKLVRCSYGAVFDVVVDLRADSPTYRNWESFELRDDEQASLYVPAGCAHGFQALTDPADVSYGIDRAHDRNSCVIPAQAMAGMHALIVGSELQVFAHSKHGLPLSHGEGCARVLIEFLERRCGRG